MEPIQRLISKVACLARLPRETRARLALAIETLTVKKGQAFVHAGDKPDGFYGIAEGRVNLVAHLPGGTTKVLDILLAGQSFGEAFMFLNRRYAYDALAATDALVLRIGRCAVLTEVDASPQFAHHMLEVLSKHLVDGIQETRSHALSATQRFAQLLLRYASAQSKSGALSLRLPARKTDVASRIDLSPEHLSRLLRFMSMHGLIHVSGSEVSIVDAAAMRSIARGKQPGINPHIQESGMPLSAHPV